MPGNPNAPLRHPLFTLEFRDFSRIFAKFSEFRDFFSAFRAGASNCANANASGRKKKSDHYSMITEGAGGSQNQEIHQLLLKKLDGNFFFLRPNPLSTFKSYSELG